MILGIEETFEIGKDTFFNSDSPITSYYVIFEDDLTTGYFYAVEKKSNLQILDALHIYNAIDVIDKDKLCEIRIIWSNNGLVVFLLINGYCHALFDFENQAGYCRTAFPKSQSNWTKVKERNLTDELLSELIQNNP